ncbi:MAG: mechanosensitive ion channel [Clostridia bacterium]|nr:mechanosensitive ion channel [Clostridia bacterium]
MDAFLETVEKIWENRFVQSGVYLLLAFVSAWLASFIVKRLIGLVHLDKKVGRERHGTALKFIGKLVFLIVFLLFMPAVLGPLGLESVSEPIGELLGDLIGYLPNIIAALVLLFVGIFIGGILGEVVTALLKKTRIDTLTEKLSRGGENNSEGGEETPTVSEHAISTAIGKLVYAVIVLISVVQALTVLGIEAISAPALSVIDSLFSAIPDIILAAVVIAVGIFVANIAGGLVSSLLRGVGFDAIVSRMMPGGKGRVSAEKIAATVTRAAIIIFAVAEGIDILGFEMLGNIASGVLGYLPMIIKAVITAGVAYFGANALSGFISKNMKSGSGIGTLVRAIIYTIAAFMILSQLGFAPSIVNFAFVIILGAMGIAFAIAFGIGGRDFAKQLLGKIKTDGKSTEGSEGQNKQNNNS